MFDPIPDDPCRVLGEWLEFAREKSGQTNWNVMMLATVNSSGQPSARAVLHKDFNPKTGALTFHTNYKSRKAGDIETNPQVGLLMHWDKLERQIRIEGRAERATPEVSDAYFATRDRESQIGAWASDQSAEMEDWSMLLSRVIEVGTQYANQEIPRPPFWGGYVVIPDSIEFWAGRPGRIHERVIFERDSSPPNKWKFRRLFP